MIVRLIEGPFFKMETENIFNKAIIFSELHLVRQHEFRIQEFLEFHSTFSFWNPAAMLRKCFLSLSDLTGKSEIFPLDLMYAA